MVYDQRVKASVYKYNRTHREAYLRQHRKDNNTYYLKNRIQLLKLRKFRRLLERFEQIFPYLWKKRMDLNDYNSNYEYLLKQEMIISLV